MTDLSPATRAIWTAFKMANCDPYLVDPRKASLAAALQAAADQAADLQVPWSYTGESYQTYDKGLHAAAEHLRAIATELGAPPTTKAPGAGTNASTTARLIA